MMQAISAGALAVLVGTLGYKFGVLVGIPVSIVSLFVYCYSGLGAVRLVCFKTVLLFFLFFFNFLW